VGTDTPTSKPDPYKDNEGDFNLVYLSRLGQHDLMYVAELDGVVANKDFVGGMNPKEDQGLLNICDLVELKTNRCFFQGKVPYSFKK